LRLDPSQEKLLRGEGGEAKKTAAEMVVRFGDESGADSLLPIRSAHVQADYLGLGEEGAALVGRFAAAGGRFTVPASLGPASIDMGAWEAFGVPSAFARRQVAVCEALGRLGGMRSWTCVPYQVCNFPKAGEAVAWADPSAVLFANSVLGARTNRTPQGIDVACAVLGLAPRFGMLADGGPAEVVFTVPKGGLTDLEYRSLGYVVGKAAGARVPAVDGLPKDASSDDVKHLCAAASAVGPLTIVRMVGVTPGTRSAAEATGGARAEAVPIGRPDLEEVRGELNQTDEAPDLVALGAPQLSASELGLLAKLLRGRRARPGINVYAYTSGQALEMASMSGMEAEIEAAGCTLSQGTDADVSPLKAMGFRVVMTNSALLAVTLRAKGEVKVRYSSLREAVEAATA
jgi:hypothetical protein